MLEKKWWERWQLHAGCNEGADDAASGESDVDHIVKDDAPAGASGTAGAAEDAADNVAVAAAEAEAEAGAGAENTDTTDDVDSETAAAAAAATEPRSIKAEEGRPIAVPPRVSVGGSEGDGDGDGPGKAGGKPAKAGGEARTSGDPKTGVRYVNGSHVFFVLLHPV